MKKVFLVVFLLALIVLLFPPEAGAEGQAVEVSSAQLIEESEKYDGREVIYSGEAVGDVMVRDEFAWVNVNDDLYSREALLESGKQVGGNSGIGVWLPREEAEKIEMLGRFGTVGDKVEVRGVFYADDVQHGGDLDIQAYSLTVLEPGKDIDTSPDYWKYYVMAAALIFLLLSITPRMKRRAREMKSARALLAGEDEEED